MTRRQPEGRYTVGDKACPSLGCAIAYSTDLAFRTGQDQYVRVIAPEARGRAGGTIGQQGSVYRAEYRNGTVIGVML